MAAVKGRYPWGVGVTSFVLPADLVTNVRCAAPLADAVQLLFFESPSQAVLDHPLDLPELSRIAAEQQLRYTVHLPIDIRLGAGERQLRQQGVDEIDALVGKLAILSPESYDLHLAGEPELASEVWLDNLAWSLRELKRRLGQEARRLAIENIEYPLDPLLPLVTEFDLSLCLDMGHVLRYGHDWQQAVEEFLPRARHLHLHGVSGGRDHRALAAADGSWLLGLGERLRHLDFSGVVTLELYALERVEQSLAVIAEAWRPFAQQDEDEK